METDGHGQAAAVEEACCVGEQGEREEHEHASQALEPTFGFDRSRGRVELWLEDQAKYYVCNEQAGQAMSTPCAQRRESSPTSRSTESTPPTSFDYHGQFYDAAVVSTQRYIDSFTQSHPKAQPKRPTAQ